MNLTGELCTNAFGSRPGANCILYHEPECDGTKGTREMGNGDIIMDIEKVSRTNETFEVESISIREGCELIVHAGN